MISKELLSEVLEDKVVEFVSYSGNKIFFNKQLNDDGTRKMSFAWEDTCINIYTNLQLNVKSGQI
jgi:hypothetical protein